MRAWIGLVSLLLLLLLPNGSTSAPPKKPEEGDPWRVFTRILRAWLLVPLAEAQPEDRCRWPHSREGDAQLEETLPQSLCLPECSARGLMPALRLDPLGPTEPLTSRLAPMPEPLGPPSLLEVETTRWPAHHEQTPWSRES